MSIGGDQETGSPLLGAAHAINTSSQTRMRKSTADEPPRRPSRARSTGQETTTISEAGWWHRTGVVQAVVRFALVVAHAARAGALLGRARALLAVRGLVALG